MPLLTILKALFRSRTMHITFLSLFSSPLNDLNDRNRYNSTNFQDFEIFSRRFVRFVKKCVQFLKCHLQLLQKSCQNIIYFAIFIQWLTELFLSSHVEIIMKISTDLICIMYNFLLQTVSNSKLLGNLL